MLIREPDKIQLSHRYRVECGYILGKDPSNAQKVLDLARKAQQDDLADFKPVETSLCNPTPCRANVQSETKKSNLGS